jgi:hypothetical protein
MVQRKKLTELVDDEAEIENPEGIRSDIGHDFVQALLTAV